MTNESTHYDGAAWTERLTTHVNMAAEPIQALPIELHSRALAMLAACFDRELKPLPSGRGRNYRHSPNFARNDDRR